MAKIFRAGMSLDELARQARAHYADKATIAAEKWEAKRRVMTENYKRLPFGNLVKSNYERAINAARYRYGDPDKWETNWKDAVSK